MSFTSPGRLDEAFHVGRTVAAQAIRHDDRAAWLGVNPRVHGGRRISERIGAEVATGVAGIGWFLARLAAATDDAELGGLATAALRTALGDGSDLVSEGRLGWYDGALGVAWSAIDAGSAVTDAELVDRGVALANHVLGQPTTTQDGPALVGGAADVLTGLLGIADVIEDQSFLPTYTELSQQVGQAIADPARYAPGMARGTTGAAVALAAWARATGHNDLAGAAHAALGAARWWLEPGMGWYTAQGHGEPAAVPGTTSVDWSWCGGAAGIGLGHLAKHVADGSVADLADLTAAVELVRDALGHDDGRQRGLCHGTDGAIDMLLMTGATLGVGDHLHAAARSARMLRPQQAMGTAAVRPGPGGDDPSLMQGAAGQGLVLLRLADGGLTPSPTLPPFLLPPEVDRQPLK